MGLVSDTASGIQTVLAAVTDIGLTFDHQPLPPNDWSEYIATFSTTVASYKSGARHIRAWTINYLGEQRERRTVALGGSAKIDRQTRWIVRGFLAWEDSGSDAVFRDLTEAVAAALDSARTLGGTVEDHTAVFVNLPNNANGVMFGSTLCHYVEITFTAKAESTLVQT